MVTRQMPLWDIDKTVGIKHFANDSRRSATSRSTPSRDGWTRSAARDPADMPKTRVAEDQRLELRRAVRSADLVITSPKFAMGATSQDAWH